MSIDLKKVVEQATTWLGTPYKTGGTVKGPNGGVDCSHNVHLVYKDAGYEYPYSPTNTFPPAGYFVSIDREDAKEGDILLFEGHMGIVATNPADGSTDIISAQGSPTKPGKVQYGKSEWFGALKGAYHWNK
jgi:cell wall-associated NlpC family hydrolase